MTGQTEMTFNKYYSLLFFVTQKYMLSKEKSVNACKKKEKNKYRHTSDRLQVQFQGRAIM